MAEISVSAAVNEGFSLIRRRPMTVASWGLVYALGFGAIFALMAPVYIGVFAPIVQAARAGAAAPDPTLMQAQILRMQGVSYLVNFGVLLMSSVLYCAVFRAVLHPERSRFAYLRVGPPELYLFFLILVGSVVLGVGMVIAMIPIGIVIGVLAAMHIVAAAVIVGVIAFIGLIVAMVYLVLRLAFVGPMMVDDGQFHLGDAWTLTKGRVGGLFLITLVVFAVLIAAEIVLALLMAAVGIGGLSAIAGGFSGVPALFRQPPQAIMARIAPILAIVALIWIPVIGGFMAIAGAPWARAYRDVRPATEAAEAFA